jgi:hypothetical protein
VEVIRALAGPTVRGFPALGGYLERGRSLVLRGGIPIGNTGPPYDFTWAFVLEDGPAGTTRLLVRERYAYTRPWARLLVEPVEAVSFVMSRKMPGESGTGLNTPLAYHHRARHRPRGPPRSLAR